MPQPPDPPQSPGPPPVSVVRQTWHGILVALLVAVLLTILFTPWWLLVWVGIVFGHIVTVAAVVEDLGETIDQVVKDRERKGR